MLTEIVCPCMLCCNPLALNAKRAINASRFVNEMNDVTINLHLTYHTVTVKFL